MRGKFASVAPGVAAAIVYAVAAGAAYADPIS